MQRHRSSLSSRNVSPAQKAIYASAAPVTPTDYSRRLVVGYNVEIAGGKSGVVRFVGSTAFADGEWVGVELNSQTGRNDGSYAGTRYFSCDAACGVFVREGNVVRIRPNSVFAARTSSCVPPAPALEQLIDHPEALHSSTLLERQSFIPRPKQHQKHSTPNLNVNTISHRCCRH